VGSTLGFAFVIKKLGYAKFNFSVEFWGKGHQNSTQGQEFYPYILCLNSGSGSEGSVNEQGTSTGSPSTTISAGSTGSGGSVNEQGTSTTGSPSTTVSAGSTGSVGSVGESVPSTESPASGTTARGSDSVINPSSPKMEPFEKPKYEELSMLRFQKENIKWDLGEHDDTLKLIHKAKELDKKLPEQAKNDNHYINELKIDYFQFFENDDQIKAVDDIKSYVKKDKEALEAQLKEINSQIKSLGNVTSNF
jgi:hypothetical protein